MPTEEGHMSKLSTETRMRVLAALVEGNGIRTTERLTAVHRDTIMRFALAIGHGCDRLHDRLIRDLPCTRLQMDEQHSWVFKRAKNITPEDSDEIGEQWSWVVMDVNSRLIVSYVVGKRNQESANALVDDARSRVVVSPSIATDGLRMYEAPIEATFGTSVDYGQMIKRTTPRELRNSAEQRTKPKEAFIEKRTVFGAPEVKHISTAYIERNNLSARHTNARLGRRTLHFSKKLENHKAAVSLCYVYYNFCHVVSTLRVTPAMAANVTDHVWDLEEFMDAVLTEPAGAKPVAQPLAHRMPKETARELPNGRGFLRVVEGGKGGPAPTNPGPTPAAPREHVTVPVSSGPAGQVDLWSWKAPPVKPRQAVQLDLFGLEIEPTPES
jgi:IS1 family transposase